MARTRSQAQVAEAKRLYHLGLDTRAVAAQMGVDPRTVARWLAGEVRRTGPRGRVDVATSLILQLRAEGLSWREIAADTGMSPTGVRLRHDQATGKGRPDRPS